MTEVVDRTEKTVAEQQLEALIRIEESLLQLLRQQAQIARSLSVLVGSAQHGRI